MTENPERWVVRKPAVTSRGGVIATQHQAASEAGARVLADGGNAVDAAIAASPCTGHGRALDERARRRRVHARPPCRRGPIVRRLLRDGGARRIGPCGLPAHRRGWRGLVRLAGCRGRPQHARSVCGRGAGAGRGASRWRGSASAAGAGPTSWRPRAPWPSGAWRSTGMPPSRLRRPRRSSCRTPAAPPPISRMASRWRRPGPGDAPRIRLGSLAGTLRRLAEAGPADFYTGEIARAICDDMAALGGRLSETDLADYEARVEEAPATRYRDALVSTAPGLNRRADADRCPEPPRRLARSGRGAPRRRGLLRLCRGIACRLRRASPGHGRGHPRGPCVLHEPSRRCGPGRHRGRADPDPAFPPSAPR